MAKVPIQAANIFGSGFTAVFSAGCAAQHNFRRLAAIIRRLKRLADDHLFTTFYSDFRASIFGR
jgi:hypothetical protein